MHDIENRKMSGQIEVICGSMFSGKTEELIRRIRRAQIAKQRVEIFKPKIDNRYSESEIVSHNEQKIPSTVVETAEQILLFSAEADVIGVDEAQFFDSYLVEVCQRLAAQGKRVIVAGLDTDYRAIAEYITKTLAVCVKCGAPANRTQRISNTGDRVLVGATDLYEARCRSCYEEPVD
jgi:thymidine kinase